MLIVRVTLAPKFTLLVNVKLALATAGAVDEPKVKLPPIFIPPGYLPLKSLVAFAAIVPLLMVSVLLPNAFTPLKITVPSFKVNPPVYVDPVTANAPAPVFTKPVPAATDIGCVPKSKSILGATLIEATLPPVPSVPPAVTVTF